MPAFSIITPSFNQGRFIERTIKSVLSQGIEGLEYIIIDGGSRDETLAILKKYSNQLIFLSEPDHGQAHAVNKGLTISRGEIIGWLNSDDVYLRGALNSILNFFAKNPDTDVVYGQALHIDENDNPLNLYPTRSLTTKVLNSFCCIAQPSVFFRRRVMERHGMLDENLNYCMDYEYWLRLFKSGVKFAYLETVLAATRLYPGTKTMRGASGSLHRSNENA